jgi:hypothetical protein
MTRVQRGRANRLDPALTDGLLAGGLVVMGEWSGCSWGREAGWSLTVASRRPRWPGC